MNFDAFVGEIVHDSSFPSWSQGIEIPECFGCFRFGLQTEHGTIDRECSCCRCLAPVVVTQSAAVERALLLESVTDFTKLFVHQSRPMEADPMALVLAQNDLHCHLDLGHLASAMDFPLSLHHLVGNR